MQPHLESSTHCSNYSCIGNILNKPPSSRFTSLLLQQVQRNMEFNNLYKTPEERWFTTSPVNCTVVYLLSIPDVPSKTWQKKLHQMGNTNKGIMTLCLLNRAEVQYSTVQKSMNQNKNSQQYKNSEEKKTWDHRVKTTDKSVPLASIVNLLPAEKLKSYT